MNTAFNMKEALEYYRKDGAPHDQDALVALLREVQEASGGALFEEALQTIADAYQIRTSLLTALIARFPSLRLSSAKHRLEICGGPNCAKRRVPELLDHMKTVYSVKNGLSKEGCFSLHTVGCMKNCLNGPSIKWDGVLYSYATKEMLDELIASAK